MLLSRSGRWAKFLWPSQNIWTLTFHFSFSFRGQKRISAEEVKIFIDYFRKHAGSKLCVDREGFRKLISTKNSDYYSERIFSLVDQNKDNLVCIDEYTEFMTKLSTDDQNGMIEFLFKIFDTDGRCLKVSKSRKQILKFSFEPKKGQFFLYFCPSLWKEVKTKKYSM